MTNHSLATAHHTLPFSSQCKPSQDLAPTMRPSMRSTEAARPFALLKAEGTARAGSQHSNRLLCILLMQVKSCLTAARALTSAPSRDRKERPGTFPPRLKAAGARAEARSFGGPAVSGAAQAPAGHGLLIVPAAEDPNTPNLP